MNTPTTLPEAWWQLGTLHDKTLGDWLVAEIANRMATSLDMLVALQEDLGAVVTLGSRDELMRHVLEMTGCLDAIASQQADPASVSVSRAALTAAQALGYLPPSEGPPAETEFH
ncbi:MAG: hypothetical protein ACO1RX_22815 [Candidatus Sericytochromatia bacterium]